MMQTFSSRLRMVRITLDRYRDEATGVMAKDSSGKLAMTRVTLHPDVQFGGEQRPTADALVAMHYEAHEQCYIAHSVKTDIRCEPVGIK